MNKLFSLAVLLLSLGSLASQSARAQAPSSTGPTPTPASTSDPAAVPLDGGASLMLASGAAYGLRRLRQLKRSTK